MESIIEDLRAEQETLDTLVASIDEEDWLIPTPAEGWNIKDQLTHLAYYDEVAAAAIESPEAFASKVAKAAEDIEQFTQDWLALGRAKSGPEVLEWWRSARHEMLEALAPLDSKARLPWLGPPMGALSFATARLMETWSHGQDVVDALGADRAPTDRLRHVAHLGWLARPFSYRVRGMEMPADAIRVELAAPSGAVWTWGDPDAQNVVYGPAEDFCLVVTQRRHLSDTDLAVKGKTAEEWMSIAQAFAGPPGPGRRSGQFPKMSRES